MLIGARDEKPDVWVSTNQRQSPRSGWMVVQYPVAADSKYIDEMTCTEYKHSRQVLASLSDLPSCHARHFTPEPGCWRPRLVCSIYAVLLAS